MSDTLFQRIAIIGVGLLGGSIGLAVKSRGIASKVIGIGRNPERLELAMRMGAVDAVTTNLEEGCRDADLIILALPVKSIKEHVLTDTPCYLYVKALTSLENGNRVEIINALSYLILERIKLFFQYLPSLLELPA